MNALVTDLHNGLTKMFTLTRRLKRSLVVLVALSFCGPLSSVYADQGGFNGGGGDPAANDFLFYGRSAASVLASHPLPGVDVKLFNYWLDRIQKSLDGRAPMIAFPPGEVVNCFGTDKIGCVDRNRQLRVARDGFKHLPEAQKIELVSLEIFRLMGVKNRYPTGRVLSDFFRIQTQTIEGHVRFMIEHQLAPAADVLGWSVTVEASTCLNIGKFIQRADVLTELLQLVVISGNADIELLKSARHVESLADQLYPYCGINGSIDHRGYPAAIEKLKQAIRELQTALGPEPERKELSIGDAKPQPSAVPKKVNKPGLAVGQQFVLSGDLKLEPEILGSEWNFFVNGRRITLRDLSKREGQGFCAVNATEGKRPTELLMNGIRTVPGSATPYTVSDISWYIETVFFTGHMPNGTEVGFVVYCGTVKGGDVAGAEKTSLAAIQTHFAGLLSLKR